MPARLVDESLSFFAVHRRACRRRGTYVRANKIIRQSHKRVGERREDPRTRALRANSQYVPQACNVAEMPGGVEPSGLGPPETICSERMTKGFAVCISGQFVPGQTMP